MPEKAAISLGRTIEELHQKFISAAPFPYICLDNFLDLSLAKSLSDNFPSLQNMDVFYKGLNERKGEHSSFENLHEDFASLRKKLSTKDFVQQIETITGFKDLHLIDDRYGCGLHQGGNNSFLDTHIDYNLHPILKKQRRLNLIIFLNEKWEKDWGGFLQFSDSSGTKCVTSIEPKFNRAVIFICNPISYHGYNRIQCPETVTRKSFYLYFFSEPEKHLIFHDTVFTIKPQDSFLRKTRIITKEFLKNTIKRILYYTGLNQLLK
ncbi:MAG TPA: 2OG-Fe(II) oxygenase [Hanamia sp.]|nr:2OG-Fe(II) oxygenase [Hanamia sp.]